MKLKCYSKQERSILVVFGFLVKIWDKNKLGADSQNKSLKLVVKENEAQTLLQRKNFILAPNVDKVKH